MVIYTYNPSTQKAEAGISCFQGHPGYIMRFETFLVYNMTLSPKLNMKRKYGVKWEVEGKREGIKERNNHRHMKQNVKAAKS